MTWLGSIRNWLRGAHEAVVAPTPEPSAPPGRVSFDEVAEQLGVIAVDLAANFPDWVRRRKTWFEFVDETTVAQRMSVDFVLPDQRRGGEQLRERGITIRRIRGLGELGRLDARAVEQVLINRYGLAKQEGVLLNRINSIAPSNPIYEYQLQRGEELLRRAGYPGF